MNYSLLRDGLINSYFCNLLEIYKCFLAKVRVRVMNKIPMFPVYIRVF